jgi:hypothetical protein
MLVSSRDATAVFAEAWMRRLDIEAQNWVQWRG